MKRYCEILSNTSKIEIPSAIALNLASESQITPCFRFGLYRYRGCKNEKRNIENCGLSHIDKRLE